MFTATPKRWKDYVAALTTEIEKYPFVNENSAATIYFGGGTPSLLTPFQLEKILAALHRKFVIAANCEFTLEMNPATVSLEKLRDFKSLGVNRASFGVQTFDDDALKMLARGHDTNEARETFRLLREAGFDNISLDLIAGLPRQTLADWKLNLIEALHLKPEHLSLYLLEIHEGTPLAEQIRSRRQPLPDEDLSAEMYRILLETTEKAGYRQYEISNFALPGYESQHNSKYWTCEPIFSFGVSAHGFNGANRRWANEKNTAKYVELINSAGSAVVEETDLTAEEVQSEYIFLGLRLMKGINLKEFHRRFGIRLEEKYVGEINGLREAGLVRINEERLCLTKKGALFSNNVFTEFV